MTCAKLTSIAALLLLVLLASCQPSNPCDPGFQESVGQCLPIPMDSGNGNGDGDEDGGSEGTAGTDADAATDEQPVPGTCEPGEGSPASFGAACMSDDDCACPAPTCLPSPLSYCSRLSCQDDPSVCPAGFTCFNVPASLQQDGVTHLCLRQG